MCEKIEPGWLDTGYEEAEDAWRDKTGELAALKFVLFSLAR